jgi:hypothetical protein
MSDFDRLVDTERGIVSCEIFVNDGVFAEELEKLLPAPGCLSGTRAKWPIPATSWGRGSAPNR